MLFLNVDFQKLVLSKKLFDRHSFRLSHRTLGEGKFRCKSDGTDDAIRWLLSL